MSDAILIEVSTVDLGISIDAFPKVFELRAEGRDVEADALVDLDRACDAPLMALVSRKFIAGTPETMPPDAFCVRDVLAIIRRKADLVSSATGVRFHVRDRSSS